jgi:hypothetical protein
MMLGFAVFIYILNYWLETIQSLIFNLIDAQSIFKHIFDNSEESIVIVTDNKIDYMNDMFLS